MVSRYLNHVKHEVYRHLPVIVARGWAPRYPVVLQIYLESQCNLRCWFCKADRSDRPRGFDVRSVDKLDEAIKHARYISIAACGEPLLAPSFPAVLEKILGLNRRAGLIAIVTNGTRLSPDLAKVGKHLGDLAISLNAGTAETYDRDMKGGDFDETLEAIRSFMKVYPDSYKVSLHMVAHARNHEEIPEMVRLARSLGISRVRVDQLLVHRAEDVRFNLQQVKSAYNLSVHIGRKVAKDMRVHFTAKQFGGKDKMRTCLSPVLESYVWADGRVAPCDWNGRLFMGNAYETSFEEVWSGDRYRSLRRHPAPQCLACPRVLPFDDPRAHISPWYRDSLVVKEA